MAAASPVRGCNALFIPHVLDVSVRPGGESSQTARSRQRFRRPRHEHLL